MAADGRNYGTFPYRQGGESMTNGLWRFVTRLRNLLMVKKNGERFRQEMEEHLAMQTEENLRAGMSQEEARRQAILKFGAAEAIRESYRAEEGLPFIEIFFQDMRYALRMLRKSPGFTIVAVLTLALGIGANSSIFTLINAVMLKDLPVADPRTLVRLGNQMDCCVGTGVNDAGEFSYFSTETYETLRKNVPEFEDLAAMQAGFTYRPVVVRRESTHEAARSVMGEFVSGNYFRTFGLKPALGRLFIDGDDVQGASVALVISYETWKSNYNGDPSIVGSTFYVNTKPVTVVGIAPKGFYGDRLVSTPPNFYLPIESMPDLANAPYVHDSRTQWLYMIGRIKPGVSHAQLQEKISAILRQDLVKTGRYSAAHDAQALARAHIVLTPGGAGIAVLRDQYEAHLRLLMIASGLVLLIACANIANLLLVRGMARKAEMSVRTALGAMRSRIIRQLLTESVLLSGFGGLTGLSVAYVGTRMLVTLAFPGAQEMPIEAAPSSVVLAFACGLSVLTGILFGIAPAWMAAQTEPVDALRNGTRSTAGGATLLQRTLVVTQAALSLVLLVGAGLFAESLGKLKNIDLKLDSRNRYIVHFNPQAAGYSTTQVAPLYTLIEERFHALPGIERVGISSFTPMEDNNNGWGVVIQGKPETGNGASVVKANAEYFDSVGTHVLMGRGIRVSDTPASPTIAVVNESFVKKFFQHGENPIGHHFGNGPERSDQFEIVGVVEDTAYQSARWRDHRMYFVPMLQRPKGDNSPIAEDTNLYAGAIVLQTARPMRNIEKLTQKTLASINPNLSVVKFQTFEEQISDRFANERMMSRLTMSFGGLALLLATLGMYGVTAYSVARRTTEIGIRMALGAERLGVTVMIMRGALLQSSVGLAIGIPIALFCVHLVTTQLYEIKQLDAVTLFFPVLTIVLATLLAGLLPARRAVSIDPAMALRSE